MFCNVGLTTIDINLSAMYRGFQKKRRAKKRRRARTAERFNWNLRAKRKPQNTKPISLKKQLKRFLNRSRFKRPTRLGIDASLSSRKFSLL